MPEERRSEALFLLTLIAGGLMVAAAILRLGRFTRFVPHSVMIGFLTGVAVNIVLGQLPDLVGSDVSGDFALAKAWHLLLDLQSIDIASLITGVSAIVILVALARTRLAAYSSLIALAVPDGGGDRPRRRHGPTRERRRRDSARPPAPRTPPAQRALLRRHPRAPVPWRRSC